MEIRMEGDVELDSNDYRAACIHEAGHAVMNARYELIFTELHISPLVSGQFGGYTLRVQNHSSEVTPDGVLGVVENRKEVLAAITRLQAGKPVDSAALANLVPSPTDWVDVEVDRLQRRSKLAI